MLARRALVAALRSGPACGPAAQLLPHRRVCASSDTPQPDAMAPKRKTAAKASGGVQKKKAAKPAAAAPPAVAVSATDIAIEACKS